MMAGVEAYKRWLDSNVRANVMNAKTKAADGFLTVWMREPVSSDFKQYTDLATKLKHVKANVDQTGNFTVAGDKKFDFSGSVFFVLTMLTTIGYGAHGTPQTPRGRVVAVVFSVFGIAVTSYFLTLIASSILWGISACEKSVGCRDEDSDLHLDTRSGVQYLIIFLAVVTLLGAFVYQDIIECSYPGGRLGPDGDGSYWDALYFLIISFSTIGFGDCYPEKDSYARSFSLFFLLLGLAPVAIILGSIGEEVAQQVEKSIMEKCFGATAAEEFVLTKVPRVRTVKKEGAEFDAPTSQMEMPSTPEVL